MPNNSNHNKSNCFKTNSAMSWTFYIGNGLDFCALGFVFAFLTCRWSMGKLLNIKKSLMKRFLVHGSRRLTLYSYYCKHACPSSVRPSLNFHTPTSPKTWREFDKSFRKQVFIVFYQVSVGVAVGNKDGRHDLWLADTCLYFSATADRIQRPRQEASTQRPLPSLSFSRRSENKDGRSGLW